MRIYKLYLLTILCLVLNMNAYAAELDIYHDISYDYELVHGAYRYDCYGVLRISTRVPDGVEFVLLERTNPNYPQIGDTIFFGLKNGVETNGADSINFEIPNVQWNVNFRLRFISGDSNSGKTLVYNTNSFIDPDDLELLLSHSDISAPTVDEDDLVMTVSNHSLWIETRQKVSLTVSGLDGRLIYSDVISGSTTIPIYSELVIVQYNVNNKVITKKILIK